MRRDVAVRYYAPFGHYLSADLLRSFTLLGAVCVGASVLLLARRRWAEERHSASVFLLAIALAMVVFGAASIVALGRPPTWWYIALELLVEAMVAIACYLAAQEAKRGVWARRTP